MSLDLWLDIDEALLANDTLIASLPQEAEFKRWAEAALLAAGEMNRHVSLDIRLVGEVESQALNNDYRGKDYSTNVLYCD